MKELELADVIEPLFTIQQVARFWGVSEGLIRKMFRDRPGVIVLTGDVFNSNGKKRRHRSGMRIPRSLLVQVMVEKGYAREQAEAVLKQAMAALATT